MTEAKAKYTQEEVLEIFKEQHRLCSPLDPEADLWAEITPEMTIRDWRAANDLLGWKKLSKFLNQEFRIDISENEWRQTLEPAKIRKLIDVCRLVSKYAEKDIYEPITLFGRPCLKAGVFLTIKKNLEIKGVNVSELRPSSLLSEYLNKYFSPVIEEITKTGTKTIDKIEVERSKKGFWDALNLFNPKHYEISTREIKTFRDLTERIIEKERNLSSTKPEL